MIYRLQKKFIIICAMSILGVIILVFALLTTFNTITMNRTLDGLADNVVRNIGKPIREPNINPFDKDPHFSTRHFFFIYDNEGEITKTNIETMMDITETEAKSYADKVNTSNKNKGWISNYRYKVIENTDSKTIVFVDGNMYMTSFLQSMMISIIVLLGLGGLIIVLIIIFSRKVVKPIADSYEKQKQFITDANHELKTPLTLILANLEIAEAELGKNEWLEDIKEESKRMTELVNKLVVLTKADEDKQKIEKTHFAFSEILEDTLSDFKSLIEKEKLTLQSDIEKNIMYYGEETLIQHVICILLDNAVKYCDELGTITICLKKKRHIILTVENTFKEVDKLELDKLFDRFYRFDKARTSSNSFGIGLSIAKAIMDKHNSEIISYKKNGIIGFKATFKSN